MMDEKTVTMEPEQVSRVKAGEQRITSLSSAYVQAARQAGEIKDQLTEAEAAEAKARLLLKEAEVEQGATVNEIAVELGYKQGAPWSYNQKEFSFTVGINKKNNEPDPEPDKE